MERQTNIPLEGSNEDKSLDIFNNRLAYAIYAIPEKEKYPTVRSFWDFESIFYGRVDQNYTSIVPKQDKTVEIESNLYLMDFVADAYREMKAEFKHAVQNGRIPEQTPHFSDFKATSALVNPTTRYDQIYNTILNTIVRTVIGDPTLSKRSLTFRGFYSVFRDLIKVTAKTYPVCVSDYMTSKQTYLPNTGLSFEIASLLDSEDSEKINFLDSICFDYYSGVAAKYGFYIDENAPWRLVANLSSEPMQGFMTARNGTSSISSYFLSYTTAAYTYDYMSLRNMCVEAYKQIVLAKPSYLEVTAKGDGSYCTFRTNREQLDSNQIEKFVPIAEWINLYTNVKNIFKDNYFDMSTINQIIERALTILELNTLEDCLRYIDRYFNDYESIEGSLNYNLQKQYLKNSQISLDNFNEYVKLITKQFNHRDY